LRVLQGRFWEIAGRSSVELRMAAGLAQDSTSHSPASQWHRFASGRGRSQTGEARAGGLLDYTDNRGCRQRKHFQTKRMPTLSASRPKRHLPGAGLSCKPCGAQPLTGRAAIACVNAGRISRTRRIRVRYGGTPPEHILAADCRDDLASAASPPACPFLGLPTMWCSLLTIEWFPRCNRPSETERSPLPGMAPYAAFI
jgi:hypothetical protein